MNSKSRGALIATAVGALLAACGGASATSAPPTAAEMVGKVKCTGINECRGKGVCAQADHACGGKNACKGQGVALVTADDCGAKGGKSL
jgi:hypothetical protein